METMHYPPEELIPIVAELAAKYAGFEHSSIPYEKAQMLMEAVLYCIREYETIDRFGISERSESPSASLPAGSGRPSAKGAYRKGLCLVLEKLERLRKLYNSLIDSFIWYGSECLHDSVTRDIPAFLLKYDAKYAPQETLIMPDYPILGGIGTATGVDAVLLYTEGISLEQRFLRPYDISYVVELLSAYHEDYAILPENICALVLQNTLGHVILGKPLHAKGFCAEEYVHMELILSEKSAPETERYVTGLLEALIRQYYGNDFRILDYLKRAIPDMTARLRNGIKYHNLQSMILF